MLFDADLPEMYWHHAIQHAAYIHNVSPTHALDDKTLEEAWSGTKPDLSRLRIFGCKVFVHILDSLHSKLGSKSLICVYLGYTPQHKAFHLVHLPSQHFLTSRDVIFDEKGVTLLVEHLVIDTDMRHETQTIDQQPSITPLEPADGEPPIPTAITWTPPSPNILSRPKCVTKPPSHYGIHASIAHTDLTRDPQTYAEAMSRPDATKWELAYEDEKHCFERMGVYEIVPRPENRKVMGSKWVFQIKRGPTGETEKHKAHIIGKGFTQIEGLDYDETFAPVAKFASLRTILAIATELDFEVHQMDVKSAYLNSKL